MPYKEKLRNPSNPNARQKLCYKVVNCSEYNKSLKKRGAVSCYFPYGDIRSHFINDESYIRGVSGRQATYKIAYIQLIFTFYRMFGWGIRQMTGYFEDTWRNLKLDIPVPSFGHLSDLFAGLPIEVKQFCNKLAKRVERGEAIELIADSTGLRFGKASEWYEEKYGKLCVRKPWKKMHLSMDAEFNTHAVKITDYEAADGQMLGKLIPEGIAIGKVIADGAYYSKYYCATIKIAGRQRIGLLV